MKPQRLAILVSVSSVAGLILVWYFAGLQGWLAPTSGVPTVLDVIQAGKLWVQQGRLTEDVPISLGRALAGIAIGALLGTTVGVLTGRLRVLYWLVGPVLNFFRALPAVALAPFLLIIFGLSETSRVAVISIGVFFPVWISAHEGTGQVDPRLIEVARNLSFSPGQTYRRVILPSALPYLVPGIRTGIAIAYIMVFISEWIGASRGIGYRLSVAHTLSSTDHIVVALIVLGVLAMVTDGLFRFGIRRMCPWLERV